MWKKREEKLKQEIGLSLKKKARSRRAITKKKQKY